MSKRKGAHDVGAYIQANSEYPVVVLFIDHVVFTLECRGGTQHAERVYAQVADAFDLWEEDRPKWIPGKPKAFCWCGAIASDLASGVLGREWSHEHAPRCRSGAHFHGNCQCKGSSS